MYRKVLELWAVFTKGLDFDLVGGAAIDMALIALMTNGIYILACFYTLWDIDTPWGHIIYCIAHVFITLAYFGHIYTKSHDILQLI